jgi:hypothetical protein
MIEIISKKHSKIDKTVVNDLLAVLKTSLFVTKTVGELISGYKDPLLTLAKIFVPEIISDDKFSLLKGVNTFDFMLSAVLFK